jgi:hypothetical protein
VTVAHTASISNCGSAAISGHFSGCAILEQVTAQATFEISTCSPPQGAFLSVFTKAGMSCLAKISHAAIHIDLGYGITKGCAYAQALEFRQYHSSVSTPITVYVTIG